MPQERYATGLTARLTQNFRPRGVSLGRPNGRSFCHLILLTLLVGLGNSPAVSAETANQGFSLHPNPVIARGSQGAWAAGYVDPGAVVFHDGKFHMLYAAIPKWPHPLAVGYASSENGVNWDKETNGPVLTAEDTGLDYKSINSNSVIVTDEGQWVLYFTLVHPEKNFVGKIGRATASSPLGPWKSDPQPVLEPGPDGAWDGKYVGNASVVKTADGYRMYYTGTGAFQVGAFSEEHQNIGMASSPDGITWAKHDDPDTGEAHYAESDPVFRTSNKEEAWDSWALTDANIQRTADGWAMIYRGTSFNTKGALGLAVSRDGIVWRRAADKPFLTTSELGKTIDFVSYLHRDGKDFVFFESGSTQGTEVFLTSRSYGY